MSDEHRTTDVVDEDELNGLAPHRIVDLHLFGRRLRACRIMQGYDRASDFVAVLRSRFGIDVSDRTVYAIERGEQMPGFDFAVACFVLLDPSPGFFAPALRDDVRAFLDRRRV